MRRLLYKCHTESIATSTSVRRATIHWFIVNSEVLVDLAHLRCEQHTYVLFSTPYLLLIHVSSPVITSGLLATTNCQIVKVPDELTVMPKMIQFLDGMFVLDRTALLSNARYRYSLYNSDCRISDHITFGRRRCQDD